MLDRKKCIFIKNSSYQKSDYYIRSAEKNLTKQKR